MHSLRSATWVAVGVRPHIGFHRLSNGRMSERNKTGGKLVPRAAVVVFLEGYTLPGRLQIDEETVAFVTSPLSIDTTDIRNIFGDALVAALRALDNARRQAEAPTVTIVGGADSDGASQPEAPAAEPVSSEAADPAPAARLGSLGLA